MLRLVTNDIDNIINRNAAKYSEIFINHRCRQEVPVFELPHNLSRWRLCRNRHVIRGHDVGHQFVGIGGQQARQEQRPDVTIVATDDINRVRSIRHCADKTQITRHHFERDIGTYGHDVDIHQAASAIFIIGKHLLQAFLVLFVERPQNLLSHRFRQVDQQVGEVIDLHAFGGRNQLLDRHAFDQVVAYFLSNFDENVTLDLRVDDFPQHGAFFSRQGLEQAGEFSGVQAIDHDPCRTHATAIELLMQQFQIGLCVLAGFHGRKV